MSRYENLHSDIEQQGYKCQLNCIEIGSRGLVTADNTKRLGEAFKFVGGRSNSSKTLVKDLSKIAIVCSYSIWNARNEPNWDSAPYLKIWFPSLPSPVFPDILLFMYIYRSILFTFLMFCISFPACLLLLWSFSVSWGVCTFFVILMYFVIIKNDEYI